jgi:serine/threonine protein kinase
MIGSIIGSYRVERELGEGGMSHVYVGRTTTATPVLPADYQVVLKVMSDELANEQTARKRFIKEAEILSKLRHRYITRFFEFIPRETGAVLVMEFVDGHPVDALIGERGALQIQEAIMVTQCLLDALVYAHGKNIVHRDIKPANLIKQKTGGVKVTDFGIAKMRDAASTGTGATVLTRSGFLLGTPHYMSPEQIREPKDAGAKSDVYSSAVVLYEMLTGVLPFNSRSLPKLIEAVYKGDKQPPSTLRPDIHKDLDAIVMKAMHPDQNQRYSTAREFYEALEEFNSHPDMIGRIIAPPVVAAAPAALTNEETSIRADKPLAYELVAVKSESGEKHKVQGDTVMVGRDRSCAIVLSHPAVSRRHARITVSDGAVVVEDLKSANGTYVNNTRVERASLKPGDVVRFGADPSCSYVVKSRAADAR